MGDGHHGWAAADFLSFVRNLLVREGMDGSINLLTVLPPGWEGKRVTVAGAPTHAGTMSFELTWQDGRPLLAWQCDNPGIKLRAPGLDHAWSSSEQAGEALLSARGSPTPRLAEGAT